MPNTNTRYLVFAVLLVSCSCASDPTSSAQPCNEDPVKPRLVYYHPAEYPEGTVDQGMEDMVLVKILIVEDGSVGEAEVISGRYDELKEAALAAAMQCEFEPGRMNCEAVPSWIAVPYRFEIDDLEHE